MKVQYARLNDPVAYGDDSMRDADIERRARQNIRIDGLEPDNLEMIVEEVAEPDIDEKVAMLRTLIRVEIEDGEDAYAKAEARLTNAAQNYQKGSPALEIGSKETFSHIWDSYTVEGRDI